MTSALNRWAERWLWVANVTILLSIVIIITYAADRAPPFKTLTMQPVAAAPGETVIFKATVWRDPVRKCSAEFSRFIFDSRGTRYDLGSASATHEMIQSMEKTSPGMMTVSIDLPQLLSQGPAKLVTALQYRCNKVHAIWPIEITSELPFTVLP